MSVLPKAVHRLNAVHIKTSVAVFADKLVLKIYMESWSTLNRQNNHKNKNNCCTHTYDFKIYCKVTVIKTVWNWHKDIHQWNRMESRNILSHRGSNDF